jgi:hypothetical protein
VQIAGSALAGSRLPVPASADLASVPANFVSPAQAGAQRLAKALGEAQDVGYVVPPATTNPTVANATLETVGGKVATAQNAAIRNSGVTNQLASRAVGLNPDVPITPEALSAVRAEAGQAAKAVRGAGDIGTDSTFRQMLQDVRSKFTGAQQSFPGTKPSPLLDEIGTLDVPTFNASHAVDKIGTLRDQASIAFRQGDNGLGLGYKQLAQALEDQITRGLQLKGTLGTGNVDPSIVRDFVAARQLIAKAHTVEDALNPATGNVSAIKLAAMLKRGEPLSGDLRTAAQFASAFPKAAQDVAPIGSAGVSHLDTAGAMLAALAGEHLSSSPFGLTAAVAYPLARWGARSYLLGPGQANAIPSVMQSAGSPKIAASLAAALAASQDAAR